MDIVFAELASPIGPVALAALENGALAALEFSGTRELEPGLKRRYGAYRVTAAVDPGGLATRLRAYFDGDLAAIRPIATETGGTPFQQSVWTLLKAIPCGATTTYGTLAQRLGKPGAQRAVGLANNRNPVSVVIPCHRVVGSDGSLVGYGGGLDRKRWLLAHEGASAEPSRLL